MSSFPGRAWEVNSALQLWHQQTFFASSIFIIVIIYIISSANTNMRGWALRVERKEGVRDFLDRLNIRLQLFLKVLRMELPQIVEDQKAVKSELIELIQQRYELAPKEARFNFEKGELQIINAMPSDDQLIRHTHDLLSAFLSTKIQNGYCYYTLSKILSLSEPIPALTSEFKAISDKKSHYHNINHLILMREILLSKLEGKSEVTKQVEEFIDDIRFISEEVIKGISKWREDLGIEPYAVFIYKEQNYTTKMITDNEGVLAALNQRQNQLYMGSPNPFFITSSGRVPGMTDSHINALLELLSEEKGRELRMMIESPFMKSQKGVDLQTEFRQLRTKGEESKLDRIRTIYKSGKTGPNQLKREDKYESTDLKIQKMMGKNQSSIKNLDRLIKEKELQVLKEMKTKKIDPTRQPRPTEAANNSSSGYKSRLQNLRVEIEKNVRQNKEKQRKKHLVKIEVRAPHPKIKVLLEKEAPGEGTVKKALEGASQESNLLRSRSTFIKQTKLQDEEQKLQSSRNVMINSGYSLKSLPNRSRSTLFSVSLRKSKPKKEEKKDKERSLEASRSREEQVADVKESIAALNSKIREQSIRSIYSSRMAAHRRTSAGFNPTTDNENKSIPAKQGQNNQANSYQGKLNQKKQHIEELKSKLAELKQENSEDRVPGSRAERAEGESLLPKERFREERSRLQLQNMRIKQEMKMEEIKFLSLKEQEFKLREEDMENRYRRQLQQIKDDLLLKQQAFESAIGEERRKNQEVEDRLREAAQQSEHIRLELKQKEIKERVFHQIAREQSLRKEREAGERDNEARRGALLQQFERQQERYRKELERKAMEVFQQQKLKLQEMHQQIRRKNQMLQLQNRRRLDQIQLLQRQKKEEEQELGRLQLELHQKQNSQRLEAHLRQSEVVQVDPAPPANNHDLDELREQVKQELFEEISRQRRQEEEEDRKYEMTRKQHLLDLQAEMRKALQFQDEEISKMEEEYRLKNQEMLKHYQETIIAKQKQTEVIGQESMNRVRGAMHREPFQLEKLVQVDTGLEHYPAPQRGQKTEQKDIDRVQSLPSPQPEQLSALQGVKAPADLIPQPIQKEHLQKIEKQLKPIEDEHLQQIEKEQFRPTEKEQLKPDPPEPDSPHPSPPQKQQKRTQQVSRLNSVSVPLQDILQDRDQIQQKYGSLLQLVSKPIKQLFISFSDIESYLNKFSSLLPPEVKEMLPFSKKELVNALRFKKVDIFDNWSFGWYRPKEKKYHLLGSFEAIPLLAAKYGEVQIQQLFLFSRNNPYQKQFLAKLIKVYQSIGYIYQKKTGEEGKHSIKFIVKIPRSPQSPSVSDQLQLSGQVIFEQHSHSDQTVLKKNCVYYLLSQGLAAYLSEQDKAELAAREDVGSKYLSKKINEEALRSQMVQTELEHHREASMTIGLPLEYFQTEEQGFYSLKTRQYELGNTHEKSFVAMYPEEKVALVVHQMREGDVPGEFHLDSYLENKLKKMDEDRETLLFLPLWASSVQFQSTAHKPYSCRQSMKPNLAFGSVVKNSVHKGDFVFLDPPFAFVVFEINAAQMLRRILFGHIVQPGEVVRQKRVVSPV